MPPPAYSTRFCLAYAPATWAQFTVQSGHRAVVKSIVLSNSQGDATHFGVVRVANHQLLLRYPAADATEIFAMTQVAYPGETIEALTDASTLAIFVSGFYFSDAAARAPDAPEYSTGSIEDAIAGGWKLG